MTISNISCACDLRHRIQLHHGARHYHDHLHEQRLRHTHRVVSTWLPTPCSLQHGKPSESLRQLITTPNQQQMLLIASFLGLH